jgi:hypothetical protein
MSSDQSTPSALPAAPPGRTFQAMRSRESSPPSRRAFVAWPGSASLVTLLSAACLLGGLWGVLEPTLDDPARSSDRWAVLGSIAGYLVSVLAAVWAMGRARSGNPDAVAASVVATALVVGYGLVLHLICPDAPAWGGFAATVGVVGLAGLWRGWVRAAAATPSAAATPLAAIAVWAVGWPAVLGWRTAVAVAPVGGGTDAPVMVCWIIGWVLLLAILIHLLVVAVRGADPWGRRELPFLSRPAMVWVMALVAAGCAIIVLGTQAHIAGLDLLRTDLLPHIAILLLVGNALRYRAVGAHVVRDAASIALLPGVAAVFGLGARGSSEDLARGLGWAPDLLQAVTTAPGLALSLALAGAALAWRHRDGGCALGAGLALTAGILACDPVHPRVAESLALGFLVVASAAWGRGREDLAVAASSCAIACLCGSRTAGDLLPLPSGTAIYAGCSAVVVWAGIRPTAVTANAVQLAAWCLGLIAAGIALAINAGGLRAEAWQAWLALGMAVPLILWCAWRRHDPLIAVAAGPATVVVAWPVLRLLIPSQRAWLGVWAAFGLLGGAVWVAIRRECRRQHLCVSRDHEPPMADAARMRPGTMQQDVPSTDDDVPQEVDHDAPYHAKEPASGPGPG